MPEDKRKAFFKEASKKMKDPDTYAVLNWMFFGGFHHFYVGRWIFALFDIVMFWLAVYFLIDSKFALGLTMLTILTIIETYELFASQGIILVHNNKAQRKLYEQINKP